ncbi:MAG: DUF427 domain-containing protein [Planctomycetota bacterium]
MKATWRDRVIAESDEARAVDGYFYFPRDAVRMEWLHATPKSASDSRCAHGVQFYDLDDGSARSERAAWSYEAPRDAMKHVDRWIGFWGDVAID